MDIERRAWLRGIWETLKEILLQKLLTHHLRSSPLVLPSHLSGLNVVVTGATSGIGLHTARELAMAGAHVVMACRNVNAANEIAQQWKEDAHQGRSLNVTVMELDLISLSSVRQFAVEWNQHLKPLHILINNAGILRMGEARTIGYMTMWVTSMAMVLVVSGAMHLQVNHVAPALLTLLLLPSLLKTSTWRIVNVNSVDAVGGHSNGGSRRADQLPTNLVDVVKTVEVYGGGVGAANLARSKAEIYLNP
ncbi:hypothetical protein TIFTF001_001556 [Ficus carica]|uniref:Uncharacterized protein n=1 Tax=Ficus carica TaxID=3494 RepID=A0AA87Z0N8_FICCA|nr:hypothetical protein TIFTF001_001556 [Ficus carica]